MNSIEVDAIALRTASAQLDALFDDASTWLTATDRAVSDSHTAWTNSSSVAFGEFTSYLDTRRELLQHNISRLSAIIIECAHRYDTQDRATATRLSAVGPDTSLDL
ncbi:type VII secretion target [Rhodococcus sp. NPDC049939]|uniref:type VII secretion target n=1 Tax=Rhodococcus sp. NPDC049939 TaxID=3155511 RepID=UPI0033C651D5